MSNQSFSYYTIEADAYGDFSVKGHKKCTRGVMRGQMLAHFIESFPSYEAASEAYPQASGGAAGYSNTFHHLPDDAEPGAGQRMGPDGLYR